jgi:hypothetical protein
MRRGPGRRKPNGADRAAEVVRQERRTEALRLCVGGLTMRAIGKRLGISHTQAEDDVRRALEEHGQQTRDQLRALTNLALDAVLEGHLEKARSGDGESARVVVLAVKQHARQNGYEAPKVLEVSGPGGGPIETRSPVIMIPPEKPD